MTKQQKVIQKPSDLESVFQLWAWVLLGWSLYRYFLKFPEWADELIFKPLIFVLPVALYIYKREKKGWQSLGITTRNIFPSLYTGIAFGFLFALEGIIMNWVKHGQLLVQPIAAFQEYGMVLLLCLSTATALSEEILGRGFIFHRIFTITGNLLYSTTVSSILFVLLHVPILVTSLKLQGSLLSIFFMTNFLLAFINSLLFARYRSIVAPVLVHMFWNMTVALYL